ncbi:hypothetical protein CVT25_009092 [Psilocybe cyanescens]|uniref:F-box domain-containing protein n=1 Tax=Psilocybe cyanescens TaxID=93625 RepID=A0A409VNG9_PSICY|nr:hypothetical protein CVT25_009092 [Psilocybe cyanescens]
MANTVPSGSMASTKAELPLPPIYNLDFDILWTIFWMNANLHWTRRRILQDEWSSFDGPRALNVLRHTSQVCRQWRDITLGSPSLWGMAIEIDLLMAHQEDYWTKEVMERAGQSPLYVSGRFDAFRPGPRNFFTTLLNKSWERIRRLDVAITRGRYLSSETWNVLFRPSPELEVIRIQNVAGWLPKLLTDEEPHPSIFADVAPALREFSIEEAPSELFSLQAPWLSQLHSLILSSHFAFNATDVLVVLARIPTLEYLELKHILRPLKEQLMPVYLPRLRTLNILTDFTTSLFLLKWITPPAGSTLILHIFNDHNDISNQDMHSFCLEITRYIDNFFSHAPFAKSLVLEPGGRTFKIRGWRSSDETESSTDHADFIISVEPRGAIRIPELGPQKLLASLSTCRFTHTTTFEFLPSGALGSDLIPLQPSFMELFSSLLSVEHLVASAHGLRVLLYFQESSPNTIIFPLLETLRLRAVGKKDPFPTSNPVSSFLKWRITAGKPVTTLDVSESILSEQWLDWTHLDEIEGLKVILRHDENDAEEYICGTGEPERLNLRSGF